MTAEKKSELLGRLFFTFQGRGDAGFCCGFRSTFHCKVDANTSSSTSYTSSSTSYTSSSTSHTSSSTSSIDLKGLKGGPFLCLTSGEDQGGFFVQGSCPWNPSIETRCWNETKGDRTQTGLLVLALGRRNRCSNREALNRRCQSEIKLFIKKHREGPCNSHGKKCGRYVYNIHIYST